MVKIGEDYKKFVSEGVNRRDFIVEWLAARGVKSVVMPIDGHDHIYVVFPKNSYSPLFKIKTVIAHYDRFEGSPGANDNSSSVFALLDWAVGLQKSGIQHNIRLVFTDGEEICSGGGISSQGAFGLAGVFKRLSITDDEVYVFDCVGRGTVPVLNKSILPAKVSNKFRKNYLELRTNMENILRNSCGSNFVTLPVSYSDNAGFLALGIGAVAMTMLPVEEANEYMFNLMRLPGLEDYITNHKVPVGISEEALDNLIPITWKKLHTAEDNIESLSSESFVLMEKILMNLAMSRTMCV